MQVLVSVGRGRCHEVAKLLREVAGSLQVKPLGKFASPYFVDKREVVFLMPNETFIAVQWAGGWDEYSIDLATVRPQTEAEMSLKTSPLTDDGFLRGQFVNGYGWLDEEKTQLGYFNNGPYPYTHCAKTIRHFAGGD